MNFNKQIYYSRLTVYYINIFTNYDYKRFLFHSKKDKFITYCIELLMY